MNSHVFFKRGTIPFFCTNLLIFCALAIVLSSCTMVIETPKPTDGTDTDLTTTAVNPATQEMTLVPLTEGVTEMPIITLPPEPTATPETVTPENFVTVEYKSENLEENIKAWQEGRMDYQLMEVTEVGWGKGLGLVVDEEKTKTSMNKHFSAYYFQGIYLGRETIKLFMNEGMANPENISLPDEYINSPRLKENLLVTFNKMADKVIGGFPNGADYTVVFVGMDNGLVVPLSMGYEVESKDFIKEALPAEMVTSYIPDGKFPGRNELGFLEGSLVKPSASLVDVKVGNAIAFELKVYKEYGFTFYINPIEFRPNNVNLNFLSIMSGLNSNAQEMVNGNLDLLAVNSGENISWRQLYTMPHVNQYFFTRK